MSRHAGQFAVSVLLIWFASRSAALSSDWPRFRGPNGSGISGAKNLPVEFGPTTNLAWRVAAPPGNSSPIIAADCVFVCGYEGKRRIVSCFDLRSGALKWEKSVEGNRIDKKSPPNDPASSTPVSDGQNVYALFSEFGLIAFTVEGVELWRTPLPSFSQPHGMSSSPILADSRIIVVADQVTNSFVAAFDTKTGKEKWKIPRGNFVGGYSTPILCENGLLVAGPAELISYSLQNGQRLWSAGKMGIMPIGSPVCDGEVVIVNNGAVPPFESLAKEMRADRDGDGRLTPDEFPDPSFKEAVRAIDRVYGNGDGAVDQQEWDGALKLMQTLNALVAVRVNNGAAKELWRMTKGTPDVCSPLLYDHVLYLLKDGGLLSSVNPETGELYRQERIPGIVGRVFSSPVAGDGKIYVVNEAGKVGVIKAGKDWQLLRINDLGEECYGTPALADGMLIIRSKNSLWAFRAN